MSQWASSLLLLLLFLREEKKLALTPFIEFMRHLQMKRRSIKKKDTILTFSLNGLYESPNHTLLHSQYFQLDKAFVNHAVHVSVCECMHNFTIFDVENKNVNRIFFA